MKGKGTPHPLAAREKEIWQQNSSQRATLLTLKELPLPLPPYPLYGGHCHLLRMMEVECELENSEIDWKELLWEYGQVSF